MTDPIPFKPVDESVERRKLAEDAKSLLDDRAFTAAILGLRKRFFEMLMVAETTETKLSLIERIRALEGLPQQLTIMVNDQKMAEARKK